MKLALKYTIAAILLAFDLAAIVAHLCDQSC
jgi:hypothetical protein